MPITVERLVGPAMAARKVEIVERKGLGHPDTMCDRIMEAVSLALCRAYREVCGTILHHNIDKGLLAAGRVERHFGGGRVIRPMTLVIGDRASRGPTGRQVPVAEIAVEAAREWIGRNLRFVDPYRDVEYQVLLAPGSAELTDIFTRPGEVREANDSSAAVGYYPLSPTEQLVLAVEAYLNGGVFKERFPETGEDVKVMAVRREEEMALTVAMPLLASRIASEADYFRRRRAIEEDLRAWLLGSTFPRADLYFNTLDRAGRGMGGLYLSLLGTSAEDADSGQVGRGNRVNGLIAVGRPMGTEAVAGKNPVSHVGKIYNVLAHRAARRIYETCPGLAEVYVQLASRIGDPIDRPHLAAVQLLPVPGKGRSRPAAAAREVMTEELARVADLCEELAEGRHPVC